MFALAKKIQRPEFLGQALYGAGLAAAEVDDLIKVAVCSDDASAQCLAHGLIIAAFRDRGKVWGSHLISTAHDACWGDDALNTIFQAMPVERWTWDQVAAIGGAIESSYWRRVPIFWMSEDSTDVTYALRNLIAAGRARQALDLAARGDQVPLASGLLIELLHKAVVQPLGTGSDVNDQTMFQHDVVEILSILDAREDVDQDDLIVLEWRYLQVLEYSRRPPKVLIRAVSERPDLFIHMLSLVFKASEGSGVVEAEPLNAEQASMMAEQAYSLLELCSRIPGTREDGTIDEDVLVAWVRNVQALAKDAGRVDIADGRIGHLLAASPMGIDGAWPAEPVRNVIELFHSKAMIDGFRIGKFNLRGVTTRLSRDGGAIERSEAANYRAWAKVVCYGHPKTARALDALAEMYERDAQREDEAAERTDWEA